jgi:hypothetical protein
MTMQLVGQRGGLLIESPQAVVALSLVLSVLSTARHPAQET